jgi:hypothetical protein
MDDAAGDHRSDRMQAILSDAAMPVPPPRMARRIGVLRDAGLQHAPIRRHDPGGNQVVERESYLSISHPSPPPSVSPEMPVLPTTPPVVARP